MRVRKGFVPLGLTIQIALNGPSQTSLGPGNCQRFGCRGIAPEHGSFRQLITRVAGLPDDAVVGGMGDDLPDDPVAGLVGVNEVPSIGHRDPKRRGVAQSRAEPQGRTIVLSRVACWHSGISRTRHGDGRGMTIVPQ